MMTTTMRNITGLGNKMKKMVRPALFHLSTIIAFGPANLFLFPPALLPVTTHKKREREKKLYDKYNKASIMNSSPFNPVQMASA